MTEENDSNQTDDIYIKSFIDFFQKIKKDSESIGNGNTGKEFENKILNILVENYTFRQKKWKRDKKNDIEFYVNISDEKQKEIKSKILKKDFLTPIENDTKEKGIFIYQPFGKQNFPDFLIFTENYIFPLEIKFSKKANIKSMPKWNSNIPKANGLYIFAIAGKHATFFLGSDFIDDQARKILLDYFNNYPITNLSDLKSEMLLLHKNSNPFGLRPYVRKDYVYNENYSTDKESFKKDIFKYSTDNNWEDNLINCLKDLIKNKDE